MLLHLHTLHEWKNSKVQVAFEYFIIAGMVLAMLLIMWAYLAGVQQSTAEQLSLSYARNSAYKIAGIADMVYAQGPPASIGTTIYIPQGVVSIQLRNLEINFRVRTSAGITDVYALTKANLTGSLPVESGYYSVIIAARNNTVEVAYS